MDTIHPRHIKLGRRTAEPIGTDYDGCIGEMTRDIYLFSCCMQNRFRDESFDTLYILKEKSLSN